MREAEGVGEPGVGGGLVEGGEVGALQVLDQGQLERLPADSGAGRGGRGCAPCRRGRRRATGARRPPGGARAVALDHDGLEQAVGADRLGEAGERVGVEVAARLLRIGSTGPVDLEQPRRVGCEPGPSSAARGAPAGLSRASSPRPRPRRRGAGPRWRSQRAPAMAAGPAGPAVPRTRRGARRRARRRPPPPCSQGRSG